MKIKNRLTKLEARSILVDDAPRVIFIIPGGMPEGQHRALSYIDAKGVDHQVFREIGEDDDALWERTQNLASEGRGKDKIEILCIDYI
jgi:hypothetical protein